VTLKAPPAIYKFSISFFLGSFFPTTPDIDPFAVSFEEHKTYLRGSVSLLSKCEKLISEVPLLFEELGG
jgi:hypothetical protein